MTKKTYADLALEISEKATKGPWVGDEFEMVAPKAPVLIPGNKRLVWADDYHINQWDAEFIAQARTMMPELARRLEIACKALGEAEGRMHGYTDKTFSDLAEELEKPMEGEE